MSFDGSVTKTSKLDYCDFRSVQLLNENLWNFIRYNTVEPERNLAGTAILLLHIKRDHYIGAGSNGPTLLRRSTRIMQQNFEMARDPDQPTEQEQQCKSLYILNQHLEQEERAGRYSTAIGFSS